MVEDDHSGSNSAYMPRVDSTSPGDGDNVATVMSSLPPNRTNLVLIVITVPEVSETSTTIQSDAGLTTYDETPVGVNSPNNTSSGSNSDIPVDGIHASASNSN